MNDWVREAIPYAAGLVALGLLAVYVWALANAAKTGRWVWFVLMLFFQPLCLAYLLFADKRPP